MSQSLKRCFSTYTEEEISVLLPHTPKVHLFKGPQCLPRPEVAICYDGLDPAGRTFDYAAIDRDGEVWLYDKEPRLDFCKGDWNIWIDPLRRVELRRQVRLASIINLNFLWLPTSWWCSSLREVRGIPVEKMTTKWVIKTWGLGYGGSGACKNGLVELPAAPVSEGVVPDETTPPSPIESLVAEIEATDRLYRMLNEDVDMILNLANISPQDIPDFPFTTTHGAIESKRSWLRNLVFNKPEYKND
jgi:hypothetical protein